MSVLTNAGSELPAVIAVETISTYSHRDEIDLSTVRVLAAGQYARAMISFAKTGFTCVS